MATIPSAGNRSRKLKCSLLLVSGVYVTGGNIPLFHSEQYFWHRFTEKTVDQVFRWILEEVTETGHFSPKAVLIDGTYIKANDHTKK